MRSLSCYPHNTFTFYQEAVSRKRDAAMKARIASHSATIHGLYNDYDASFQTDTLARMNPHGIFTAQAERDFETLYAYKSKIMQTLKIQLTTIGGRKFGNCQNCTLSEVNSFDHILPKAEFPEFIVNPKNLFPSCSMCNSYKNAAWRNGFVGTFLNLYIDQLPNVQYLFVSFTISNGGLDIVPTFRVQNPNNIPRVFFDKIESHYNKLHLCDRFSLVSDEVISTLFDTFDTAPDIYEARDQTIEVANRNRLNYGHNYWKDILKISLVQDPNFLAIFR
jgi:5-methylcytosine-specific restriction endonuclease McrA